MNTEFVERYATLAETVTFFGKPLTELSQRELLAAAAFAASETDRVRKQAQNDARMFADLSRARANAGY